MNSTVIPFNRRAMSRQGVVSMIKMTFNSPPPLGNRTKSPSQVILKPLNAFPLKKLQTMQPSLNQSVPVIKNPKSSVSTSVKAKPIRKNLLLNETVAPGDLANYTITKTIGQGTYGLVREAIRKSDRKKVAIKIYEKFHLMNPTRRERLLSEINTLRTIDHPNVVKIYDVIETNSHIYLALEHVAGLPLYKHCQTKLENRLEETEARSLFLQMAKAIEYCHSVNVSHRDLKLDNILIDKDDNIKIIDFGFANENTAKVFCGTPSYIAPEIINKKNSFGPAVDVWALGIILYVMLTGIYPFRASNDNDLYQKILFGDYVTPPWVSNLAKKLLAQMLEVDPGNRISALQVVKHPWCKPPRSLDVSKFESDSIDGIKSGYLHNKSGKSNVSIDLGKKKMPSLYKRSSTKQFNRHKKF